MQIIPLDNDRVCSKLQIFLHTHLFTHCMTPLLQNKFHMGFEVEAFVVTQADMKVLCAFRLGFEGSFLLGNLL